MSKHNLIGLDGYIYRQAFCSCGWSGRRWGDSYISNYRMKRLAKNEWKAHRDED